MSRVLALLVLVLTCLIGGTEACRAPALGSDRPGQVDHLRRAISPARPGDCAFNRSSHFFAPSDRVADRDENDNEDDFREVSDPPRTFEQLQALISRTVPRLVPPITSSIAPSWRAPLLC